MNATPANPPFTLHSGLDDGPCLLHPPRGEVWWVYPDGVLGLWDGSRRYRLDMDRVTITRSESPWSPTPAGLVYRDHELLFRRSERGLRAIATMHGRSHFVEGPAGAALIGDEKEWTDAASGRGDAQPLAEGSRSTKQR